MPERRSNEPAQLQWYARCHMTDATTPKTPAADSTALRPEPREMSWGVKCVMAKAARAPGRRNRRDRREWRQGRAKRGAALPGDDQGVAIATYYCALGCRSFGTAGMISSGVGFAD